MTQSEFKAFPKIENIKKMFMTITQKIHGTNAQIYIYEHVSLQEETDIRILAGSRTRWLTLDDDNHGFCKWVMENRQELIEKLGIGRHYGEWCGKGINAGEGLNEKHLVLFNFRRYGNMPLPERVTTVPVLYTGGFSKEVINVVMQDLKENGSRLVKGYMKPEGVVIELGGNFYKKVFDVEEVAWTKKSKPGIKREENADVSHLLQPLRLEKLISRDEKYVREYPNSLPHIVGDYFKDLVEEGQITGDEDEIKLIRKALGRSLFPFVKEMMEKE